MLSARREDCIIALAMAASTPITSSSAWAALETSGAQGSVAIGRGDQLMEARRLIGRRTHVTDLLPTLATMCKAHDLSPDQLAYIYVSAGPGSFTGLRVGITVARMLALAQGATLLAVPTLTVIAQNALQTPGPPPYVTVLLDAKRRHAYPATFALSEGGYFPIDEPAEVDPAVYLAARPPMCAVLGEGVAEHQPAVQASGLRILSDCLQYPLAEIVFQLGRTLAQRGIRHDPRTLVPVYVRPPEAEEKWAKRQAPLRS